MIRLYKYLKNKISVINVNASYTLEASILFPIILLTIIALIYLSFYMCDKNKILSVLDQTASQINFLLKYDCEAIDEGIAYDSLALRDTKFLLRSDLEHEKQKLQMYFFSKLKNKLFILKINYLDIELSTLQITLKVEYHMGISLPYILRFFMDGRKDKRSYIYCTGLINNPSEFVRRYEVLDDFLKRSDS